MNVVSFVTATLVLAAAFRFWTGNSREHTNTFVSTFNRRCPSSYRNQHEPSAVLRDANTAFRVGPDTIAGVSFQTISVQHSSSELSQMSRREVKTLIRSAKTSDDHRKIAGYFARQAQIFAKESYDHQVRSALIAANPARYKTKYPSAYDQSRFWEQYFAAKSSEATTAANLHEQLALSLTGKER